MLLGLIGIVLLVVVVNVVVKIRNHNNSINEMISSRKIQELSFISLFSIDQLSNIILKYFSKHEEAFKVKYLGKEVFVIQLTSDKNEVMKEVKLFKYIITTCKGRYVMKDSIDKMILEFWLKNAQCNNYRKLFRKEMDDLLKAEKISDSTYNELNRRFFYFIKKGD